MYVQHPVMDDAETGGLPFSFRGFTLSFLAVFNCPNLITTYLMYHYHWTYMNLFIAGLMLIVLLIQTTCISISGS